MNKSTRKTVRKNIDPRTQAVCNKIKALRIKAGYTNHEHFAWDNEINRSYYYQIERGQNLTFESFLKILDVHGLTMKEFFKDIDKYIEEDE